MVNEILPYAFAGSVVGAIELPGTITTLSADSFAGCSRLAYIRVSGATSAFLEEDGVLYSADGKTLIYCPAARSAGTLTLHHAVRRIAAGAFAECPALTAVYFAGSSAEWHSMIVGDDNDALYAAKIYFE